MSSSPSFVELLQDARSGAPEADQRLYEDIYAELRRVARRQRLRWGASPTLNTTAVVHESYLRLCRGTDLQAEDRQHFLNLAARAMRSVLIDAARRRATAKRGGDPELTPLDEADELPEIALERAPEDLLALDAALVRLERAEARLARVVELRFFCGLSEPEAAAALGVADRTVRRDWRKARAFLLAELGGVVDLQPAAPEAALHSSLS